MNNYIILEALVYSLKGNGGDFGFMEDVHARSQSQGVSADEINEYLDGLEIQGVIQIHESVRTDSGVWQQITVTEKDEDDDGLGMDDEVEREQCPH